jgi:AraC-like DNA-binding protein
VSVVYRAEGLARGSHLDYWQEVLNDVYMPIDLRGNFGPACPAQMRTAALGPIRVNDSHTRAPFRTLRTARHIRNSTPDVCLVGILVEGELRVEQDDRQAIVRPGDLSFVDPSRPSKRSFTAMRTVTFSIPRPMVPLREHDLAELTGTRIPGDRGAGALASMMARQLASRVDEVSSADAVRLGAAVVETLAVALASRLDRASALPEATQPTLLHRIYAFIEQHLADPELSLDVIAAAHHISLRYLHKLFEPETATIGDWIRRRRLERCRQDLLNPALSNRAVAAIGARWGLLDAAHFSRIFRATYGLPPAEYRRLHQTSAAAHAR